MRKRILIIVAALLFVAGSAGVALYASAYGGVSGVCSGDEGNCVAACPHCGAQYYADSSGRGRLTSGNCEKCGKDVGQGVVNEEEGI